MTRAQWPMSTKTRSPGLTRPSSSRAMRSISSWLPPWSMLFCRASFSCCCSWTWVRSCCSWALAAVSWSCIRQTCQPSSTSSARIARRTGKPDATLRPFAAFAMLLPPFGPPSVGHCSDFPYCKPFSPKIKEC